MSDGLVDVDGAVALGKAVAGVKVGTAPGNDLSHFKMKIKALKIWFILYLENILLNFFELPSFF